MIKSIKEKKSDFIEIDLTGPEGNAFNLLGVAKKLGSKTGMSKNEVDLMIKEMTSGDYENLISIIEKQFGHLVILYR